MVYSLEYCSWQSMKKRCRSKSSKSYQLYGAKGVTVCDEWYKSFQAFYNDMGPRPSKAYSLDRIDGSKGYCPENCRWATKTEQARNFKNNRYVEYNGAKILVVELADRFGINRFVFRTRVLQLKWPIDKAINTPVRKRSKSMKQ